MQVYGKDGSKCLIDATINADALPEQLKKEVGEYLAHTMCRPRGVDDGGGSVDRSVWPPTAVWHALRLRVLKMDICVRPRSLTSVIDGP